MYSPCPLVAAWGERRQAPRVTAALIAFNGPGSEGCEDFELRRAPGGRRGGDGPVSSFCKTERRPYDQVVCAVLASVRSHVPPEVFTVRSDGTEADWREALDWASALLDRPLAFPVAPDRAAAD